MEDKVSIILLSSEWHHIADTLLIAEDLTKDTSPTLANILHTIADSICCRNDLYNDFIKAEKGEK